VVGVGDHGHQRKIGVVVVVGMVGVVSTDSSSDVS